MLANYTGFIWLFLAYFWMITVRVFVPEPYATPMGISGISIFIVGMVVQTYWAKLRIADDRHIEATLRPGEKKPKGHWYFTHIESKEIASNYYKSILFMDPKIPFVHELFGKVWKINIYHYGIYTTRFRFRRARAPSLGMVVWHGGTDFGTFYEYTHLPNTKPVTIDKNAPTPNYFLIEAGGDYPEMAIFVKCSKI